jgi:hypothetical protein
MRNPSFALALPAALVLTATLGVPAQAQLKLPRVSPKATVTQTIGLTDVTVTYSRPGVKNRTIWGELVPYDQPWRTGANEATTFTTTDEIQFGGQKLAAGTYSLLTIPGKQGWKVVLNSEKDLWGSNEYKPEKDVVKLDVKPAAAEHQEWMAFSFEDLENDGGNLVLRWEKLRVAVPISVDVNSKALANARTAIAEAKPDDWRTRYQAASFTLNSEVGMDEGRKWLDQSIAIEKNYLNLSLLARWQMKEGKKKEAITTAEKAVAAGKASKDKVDTAPTEKLISEWTAAK